MNEQAVSSSGSFLKNWGDSLTNWTERWIPDALVIVWILSIITFIMALIWGDTNAHGALMAWGKGFWALLKFGMQMCLIMMTGYILACSPPIRWILDSLSSIPNAEKPYQAIIAMALFSMITAWFQWGLSLIGSAMFALFLIRRNPNTDYRLLVAAAYLGLGCTWHAGLSASAPLLVNTDNNFLIKAGSLDSTISTSQTIFTPFNIILLVIIIVVVTVLMAAMHPSKEKTYKIKPELLDRLKIYEAPERPAGSLTVYQWLNWWPGFNIIIAAAGLIWLGYAIGTKGFAKSVNLDNINLSETIVG